MPPILEQGTIRRAERLCHNVIDLRIESPRIAREVQPGQFVHIKCADDLLLRRPISVCDVEDGQLRLIVEVAGAGTRWLYGRRAGEVLDLLGPLGDRGFPTPDARGGPVLLLGGGCGVAPLLLAAKCSPVAVDMVMGFTEKCRVIMEQDFKSCCRSLTVCTDDGSYGTAGFVSQAALRLLEQEDYQAVFSCGSMAMLKSVVQAVERADIPCYLSLDERMGCGLGACLGCAVKLRGEGGAEHYGHVCKQGPVFELREVVWDV
ncbi:MAG: dihydroorotate dehydrogenase electron transfer subunit [Clostridiales bacterium]|nr:dihydroorotate dehydrogenase electron transfer subunit [Clostridiales bacterium]